MPRLFISLFLLPVLLLQAGCDWAAPRAPEGGQIRVETAPPGASVTCNGAAPRISPATFENLPAGSFTLIARQEGFRDARQAVTLMPGQKTEIALKLEPLLGLVLVQSAPAAADVTVDGAYRGKSPLLIPDFPLGTHRLKFSLPGFEEKAIELTVKDRTPLKTFVDLASKTARLTISSEPAGAAVYIDNAPRGATPCEVETAADTNSRVELKLEGFAPFAETITLQAGGKYPIEARLVPLPAELEITSTPDGARVFVDEAFKGVTPLTVTGLARGGHKLKLDMKGYESHETTITLSGAGAVREDTILVRNSGTLVLITLPDGVEVFVDGEPAGVTEASPQGGATSEPLRVDLLSQGEHTLQLTRRGYAYKPKKFTVETGQVVQLQEALTRLFIRDTALVINKGGGSYEVTGQMLRKLPNGDVEIEVNPGIIRTIAASDISKIRPIRQDAP
ncbi:MAG: PEGA domain-containing protein [Kiritimatiellia bacterium]